ncbi:hypothetical protein PoB_001695900 [Plakobranchus ocellatus]|uniref:SMB domain-containing protein n=1 Tax=Plakobranchus ocellatus TaxID=259542 RepID=A0AAV3Z7U6_9GAST|nr:hypothetical protein PoB_001695900 [Plakobranchus ocellatus]
MFFISLLVAVRTTGLQIPPVQSNVVPAVDPQSPPSPSPALQAEISELSQSPPLSPPQSSEQPPKAPPPIAVMNISNSVPDHTAEPHHETELPSTQPPNAQVLEIGNSTSSSGDLSEQPPSSQEVHARSPDGQPEPEVTTQPERIFITEQLFVPEETAKTDPPLMISQFLGAPEVRCGPEMSCVNRCHTGATSKAHQQSEGGRLLEEMIMAIGVRHTCKCDTYCTVMGDCCPDYFSVCASAHSTGQILSLILRNSQAASADDVNENDYELWIASQYLKFGSCREATFIHNDILEVSDMWMITTCPESFTDYYGGAIAEQLVYCPVERKESAEDYSYQNVLDAADNHFCIQRQGAKLPYHVAFRTCKSGDSNIDGHAYVSGCSPDGPGEDSVFPTHRPDFSLGCANTFQPIGIQSRNTTYSSVHCALCNGLTVHDLPPYLPCVEIRSSPGRLQPEYTAFAKVWYDQGTIAYTIDGLKHSYGTKCSTHVAFDPRTVLVGHCPVLLCPPDIQFFEDLLQWEMSCAIENMKYKGEYWNDFPPRSNGDLLLIISKHIENIILTIAQELWFYTETFANIFHLQCPYECYPPHQFFHSLSMDTDGNFQARYRHRGSLHYFFAFMKAVDTRMFQFHGGRTSVRNYAEKSESTQEPSEIINRMNKLVSNESSHMDSIDQVILKETKSFKTVCFTISAVSSALSGVFNVALCCQQLTITLLFTVSKLSLSASMIFYTINVHITDGDEKVMAIFMHFSWLLTAVSVTAAAKHFNIPTNQGSSSARGSPKNNATKWVMGVVIICVVLVGLCVIVDENYDSNESVGYSSHSGHLFWMSHETGCYIFSVGIIGACYLAVTTKLAVGAVRYLRTRGQSEGSSNIFTDAKRYGNKRQGATEPGTTCTLYIVHLMALYLLAVIDFADKNYGLWPLLFALVACSNGVFMLVALGGQLAELCSHRNDHHGRSSPEQNAVSESSDSCPGYENTVEETSGASKSHGLAEGAGKPSPRIYSPE